jgi:STE24 endopeptidase
MTPEILFYIIIFILVANFALEQFLEFINNKHQTDHLPEELKDVYDAEKFKLSQEYQKTKTNFGFIASTVSFVATLLFLVLGGFGWLDSLVKTFIESPFWISLAFFGILTIASDILSLPFDLYATFVIEEKYGFNKTSPALYFSDKIKGYLVGAILGGLLFYLFFLFIEMLGENFWMYFWAVAAVFIVFINMFYTSLIVPLFNKLTPLEDGDLKSSIVDYAKKVNFPLTNILVMDGSKRSTKANAYFSGFGNNKKVVLFDTLINNHSKDELIAVLAHEVGHYKRKHIVQTLLIALLQTGLILWIFSRFVNEPMLSAALGANEPGLHLNLIAFGMLYSPISLVTGILMNIFSRKNEYEADDYARTTFGSEPLITALKGLSANNLSNLTPHPWYVFFHYSHPTVLQRIRAMRLKKI